MNDNPEGTPNPLNPTPETPVEAAPAPAPEPVAPVEPVAEAPAAETPVAAPAPKKKGKAGIVIGIILGLIAIGCGVAAILVFFVFNKGGEPVTEAMTKLLNGDNRNIAITGTYSGDASGNPISVTYKAEIDTVAKAGVMTADIAGSASGMSLNANVEVRLPGDDKAYLKFSGVKQIFIDALKQSGINCDSSSVNCDTYINMMIESMSSTNSKTSMGSIISALLSLDGKWVMFEGVNLASSYTLPTGMKLDDISSHKNEVVDTYKKYPFLKSSTDNLKISKKKDTLYKVEFDYDKLASFTNELATKNGATSNVTADDLKESLASAGDIYVEIDSNKNFTRFYAAEQDFDVTYPSSINVVAPSDYTTSDSLVEIFANIIMSFMGGASSTDCTNNTSANCLPTYED